MSQKYDRYNLIHNFIPPRSIIISTTALLVLTFILLSPIKAALFQIIITILLGIFFSSIEFTLSAYSQAKLRVDWLELRIKYKESTDIKQEREYIREAAEKDKTGAGDIWLEFDETLIVSENKLHNTIDAQHFFNTYSLARPLTENRLLAAVPGFLTAIGVIGTFIGLQLGLAELQIGSDVDVSTMKAGLSHVISGASIAFMSSICGVLLSVIFNFIEKLIEKEIRKKILHLQRKIDKLFPRLSPDKQLKTIANNSERSSQSLQGLAEKIGQEMQKSMNTATEEIQRNLTQAIENALAPAINQLVNHTSNSNQKAMEELVSSFLDKFGEAGNTQREVMNQAASRMESSIGTFNSVLKDFVNKTESNQDFFTQQENERNNALFKQSQAIQKGSDLLLQKIESSLETQMNNSQQIIEQGKKLQEGSDLLLQKMESSLETQVSNSQQIIEQGSNALFKQSQAIQESNDLLLQKIESSFETQVNNSQQIIEQRSNALFKQSQAIQESNALLLQKMESSCETQMNNSQQIIEQGNNALFKQSQAIQESNDLLLQKIESSFENQMNNAQQIIEQRSNALFKQSQAIQESSDLLLQKIESSFENQMNNAQQIIEQGKEMQEGMQTILNATENSSRQLNEAAAELESFSSNIQDASDTLSENISESIAATDRITEENQKISEKISAVHQQLLEDISKFNQITENVNTLISGAENTFSRMHTQQNKYLESLRQNSNQVTERLKVNAQQLSETLKLNVEQLTHNVENMAQNTVSILNNNTQNLSESMQQYIEHLSEKMASLLNDYAETVNTQTETRLRTWSNETTEYAEVMKGAALALKEVVEDIEDKMDHSRKQN